MIIVFLKFVSLTVVITKNKALFIYIYIYHINIVLFSGPKSVKIQYKAPDILSLFYIKIYFDLNDKRFFFKYK